MSNSNNVNIEKKNKIKSILNELNKSFSNDKLIELFRYIPNNSFKEYTENLDYSYFANFDESIFCNPTLAGKFDVDVGKISILSIKTKKELNEKSGKKKQYDIAKSFLKKANEYAGGFFIFYDENSNFRFSFVYDIPLGGGKRAWSNFRRYTYFVSKDLTNRTFIEQFSSANFSSLNGIIDAFSVEKVTKEFYQQIANWYFWAIKESKFPEDCEFIEKGRNDAVIRLITRLIFIWFMKEKKIIPELFFDFNSIKKILKEFDLNGLNYYKAILQNLFFAALNNQNKEEKKFCYLDEFNNKDEILSIFKKIPFLNGGLFECLDMPKNDPENDFNRNFYIDGFCEYPDKQPKIPNYLFFGYEYTVNLSQDYNDRNYSDSKVSGILNILMSYNFTIDENSLVDQEVALDPELLGKVFENLLASYNPETSTTARKATGSFYTPRQIVDFMVEQSLKQYFLTRCKDKIENIEAKLDELFDINIENNPFNEEESNILISLIEKIKILDPAVGSGAFLMGALHKLTYVLSKIDQHNEKWKKKNIEIIEKEIQDPILKQDFIKKIEEDFSENELDYGRKLYLIKDCLCGVDIQQIAIQIAKLRFFISLLVEQKIDFNKHNFGIQPLPNLETKLVCADTLIHLENEKEKEDYLGHLFEATEYLELENRLLDIRSKYFDAFDPERKRKYKEEDKNIRLKIVSKYNEENKKNFAEQSYQKILKIAKWDPYKINSKAEWFDPEWMFGVKDRFDIVIGNPPYIQLQNNAGMLAEKYGNENYKTYKRMGDIYCLFYERGLQILKENGILCYITSNKWMRAGYGEKLREFFTEYDPQILIDLGPDVFENATVDTNILMIKKNKTSSKKLKALTLEKNNENNVEIEKQFKNNAVFLEKLDKNAWFIGSPAEIRLKEKIERIGKPLKDWDVKIYRGILTGLNDAFIIDTKKKDEILAKCKDEEERKRTEAIIKPILRGRDIKRYYYEWAGLWVIFIPWHFPLHEDNSIQGASEKAEIEFKKFYSSIYNHLSNYKESLSKRNKEETGIRYEWYTLQRCAATYYSEFEKEKVVWQRITQEPTFCLVDPSIFVLDSMAFFTGENLKYIMSILNSKLIFNYVEMIVHQYGFTGFRLANQYVEIMPIVSINSSNNFLKIKIENLADNLIQIKKQNKNANTTELEKEIDYIVYKLYDLKDEEIRIVEKIIK